MITQDQAYTLQDDCIKRIKDKKILSRMLIFEYATLLIHNTPHLFDWGKINGTILERYVLSGLDRIKEGAWKIHSQWTEAEQKRVNKISKIRW